MKRFLVMTCSVTVSRSKSDSLVSKARDCVLRVLQPSIPGPENSLPKHAIHFPAR